MNRLVILEPRWHDNVVLLADWKISKDNLVEITHASFPQLFHINGEKARSYPLTHVRAKRGVEVPMREVPLTALDIYLEES